MFAQSNLPACQGSETSMWSNCFGTFTFANREKYVGEFKNGKRNGRGNLTFYGGGKYIGEFKDDEFYGQGTLYNHHGNVAVSDIDEVVS